jgi:hypothetical protein
VCRNINACSLSGTHNYDRLPSEQLQVPGDGAITQQQHLHRHHWQQADRQCGVAIQQLQVLCALWGSNCCTASTCCLLIYIQPSKELEAGQPENTATVPAPHSPVHRNGS